MSLNGFGLTVLLLLVAKTVTASIADCDASCRLSIVESIPENLTYSPNSPRFYSTYESWRDLINVAEKTVDIASFYWTLQGHGDITDETDKEGVDIFNSLASLTHNVTLRIVQNPPSEEFPSLDSLALLKKGVASVQNLNVTELIGSGILHSKLWVVDSRHFYVGSANMDWRSLTQVKELGLLGMDCECLAEDVQKLFDVYWYLSTPGNSLPSTWSDQFNAMYNMANQASIKINGSLSSTAFWASSPPEFCASGRTNDIDALINVIATAKKFVYIAVMDYIPAVIFVKNKYYWSKIDDALRYAAYRGIHVRLMGSYWNHTDTDMIHFMKSLCDDSDVGYHGTLEARLFVVPSLTNRNIPYTRVNHNKYMVTDNSAYIGTSNWSGDYFISTGGLSCTISSAIPESDTIQEQLKELFERDWFSPYAKNMTSIAELVSVQ